MANIELAEVRSRERSNSSIGSDETDGDQRLSPDEKLFGILGVFTLTFFNVSGGPWGSEDIFSFAGPLIGTIGIFLFALVFSVPQCLITVELTSAFPTNGGYSVWVQQAFGNFWATQEFYWSWVSGVVDCAVYPVLVCDTVVQLCNLQGVDHTTLWLCRVAMTVLLSLPSVMRSGFAALLQVLGIATMLPGVLFVVLGIFWSDWSALIISVSASQRKKTLSTFTNSLFWNLEGWDCIATCGALIEEPRQRTLSVGLFAGLIVVVAQYALVLLVAAAVGQQAIPWQNWHDGTLPTVAEHAFGQWMAAAMLIGSGVGVVGLYLGEFFEDAYQLQAMADYELAPSLFSWRVFSTEAPVVPVIFQCTIVAFLVGFDFQSVLVFDNCFTAMAALLQFAAFAHLRIQKPDLPRPYRAPTILIVVLLPTAIAVVVFIIIQSFCESWFISGVSMFAFAVGVPYGLWMSRHAELFDQYLEE